jgi:hypothetical protein
VDLLHGLQSRTSSAQGEELLPEISAVFGNASIENTWQSSATGIYTNCLHYIRAQKDKTGRPKAMKAAINAPRVHWATTALTQ